MRDIYAEREGHILCHLAQPAGDADPNRTMLLRGVQRPGILVEEAEAVVPLLPTDVFVLRWTALRADVNLPLVLTRLECEILYTNGGTEPASGLDRGRVLEEMDAEVLNLLTPNCAPKMNYTQTPPVQMNTPVFWSAADFSPAVTLRDRLSRSAKVTVFAYQETGEL